jgi:hypothetical protein
MVRRSAHHLVICEGKVVGICRHNRVIYAFGELQKSFDSPKGGIGFPADKKRTKNST